MIIERLAPLPSKPQPVIVERWLPYPEPKRQVIFKRGTEPDLEYIPPRNVIIQWEAPDVSVLKNYVDLGVVTADPNDYVRRYGDSLIHSKSLPDFVHEIPHPGYELASDRKQREYPDLYGDVDALRLVNLDKEGLGMYKEPFFLKSERRVSFRESTTSFNVDGETFTSFEENSKYEVYTKTESPRDRFRNRIERIDQLAKAFKLATFV